MSDLRFGLDVWQQRASIDELRTVWETADAAGIHNLWVCDHFKSLPMRSEGLEPIFEAWTCLAAMAVATRRARIGVMVTGNTIRHPGVLAKMAVTVDHLSGGRLEFGLGAGDADKEHAMLGLDFPPAPARLARWREGLEVIRRLWTGEVVDFHGEHYQLTGAIGNPPPLQRPHPPIWLGGGGERITLRIVAEHADVWNAIGIEPLEDLARKLRVLDTHCEAIGRDPAEIRRTVQVHLDAPEDVDATTARLESLIGVGFTEFVVIIPPPNPLPRVELALTTLLPRFGFTPS